MRAFHNAKKMRLARSGEKMPGRGRRIVSFLLCLCMIAPFLSDFSGWVLSSVAEATGHVTNRKADPNTMDDYLKQLLSTDWGSRYAGRIWTDKSVLAFGQEGITNWSKMNDQWQLALDMATDGFEGIVGSKADFLHIFSALASSQQLSGVPPVRTVIVFDNSGSMYNSSKITASSGEELWQKQRIAITIESINRAIDLLMEASVYNEVSVVLFGDGTQTDRSDATNTHVYHGNNTAVTILPMKHYKPSPDKDKGYTPYLTGGWNNSKVENSFNGESPCHQGTGTDGKSGATEGGWVFVNNEICGLKAKEAEGEDWNDNGYNNCGSLAYTGYANGTTNIQAGYYVGLQELLKADKTVKIGTDIYQCVPSLVMLTDGAATDKMSGTFITPELAGNSTHLSSMGFVNDTGNKLRSFIGYREDLVDTNKNKKEIQNFWDMFVEIADDGKYESPVKNNEYSVTQPKNPIGDGLLAMKEVADTYSDSVASMLLGTLMTTAYYKAAVRKAYGIADNEDWNIYSLSVDMVDMKEVPQNAAIDAKKQENGNTVEPYDELPKNWTLGITSNAPTMDPSDFFYKDGKVNLDWLKDRGYIDADVDMTEALKNPNTVLNHTAYPDYSVGEMIIHGIVKAGYYLNEWAKDETTEPFTTKYQSWQENQGIFNRDSEWKANSKTNPYKHGNGYLLEKKQTVSWPQVDPNNAENVTKQDVLGNIGYNNFAYYAKTSDDAADDLADKFQAIIDAIAEPLFIPVEGNNAAGVSNSITYQDPLGTYMEIKNQAITAQTHKDESAGTYDMSLLLFGKMHGLVRAGVYDWNWNDQYMKKYAEAHPEAEPGTTAFPMGWYKGDDPETAVTPDSTNKDETGTWPTGYANAEEAWEDGWVFRFNFETLLQFVPITGVDTSNTTVHPSNLPDQVKNTVYTCYRFAGTQDERNELHRNPVFGDVPNELKDAWEKAKEENENNQYPDSNKLYADTPGVYRLSDIRVWVEDYGDYTDTTGAITPNQGYDRSLYLNVPAAAVPTQLATVTLGPDGVMSYDTNLGNHHKAGTYYGKDEDGNPIEVTKEMEEAFYAQSTPLRLFYAVGLEEDLILRDEKTDEQIGVDFTKISPEYILAHTVEDKNYVWFLSNFYSNTTYDEYVTDTVTSPTRGDPTVTFSPNADNRYYVFQKPLPLYAHAYRNTDDGLKAVDRNDDKLWSKENNQTGGNGKTTWETTESEGTVVQQQPGSWGGGEYMGTYKDGSTFTNAKNHLTTGTDGKKYITDDHENTYLYVENGIIFLEADVLDHVTSKPDGGYAEGSISFNSDDYYFMLVEYYLPDETTGKDQMGEVLPGTHGGRMVQRVVARRGSEFGSGFASDQIDNGDMLCWTDMSGKITLELEYLSKSDTGDLTRGEPTFEKLTIQDEDGLRTYFEKTCGIDPAKTMANPNYDSEKGEEPSTNPKEVNVINYLVQYWLDVQKDSKVQAALAEADTGEHGLTKDEFDAYFQFAVSARKGGIRSGDMSNNRHAKSDNPTNTAENYYVPTVSDNSATDNGVILNTYLGNNGYLEVANQMLHVTKLLEAPEGYTLSNAAYDEEFNFQVYVQGLSGKRSAILTEYNEFSKSWDRQLAYIDVLTDNSDLVVDNDSNRALFVKSTVEGTQGNALTAKQVIAQTDEDGDPVYYEANEDGTLPTKDDGSLDESKIVEINSENPLYYLYLPSNGDSETAKHTRRLYQNGRYDGAADGYESTNFIKNGTTTFYAKGQRKEDTGVEPGVGNNDSYRETNDEVKRPAGTITYWAQDAELIPVSEVQAAETVDSILSGEPSAYASEAVDSTPGVWTHNAESEKHKTDHVALAFFTFVIRRPSGETSMTAFESPFKTRSSYMTVDLVFGQNANEKDGGTGTGDLGASDLYDTIIPSADRSDLFGNVKKSDGTEGPIDNAYIAAHTAEFTLKHGEGLLLSGLDNRITYRFTEKLTPDQLAKGYTLKQINHIQQRDSDTVYMPGVQEIPVYVNGSGNVTWEQDGATKNMEPFAHTNAVLWESYATMTNTGNHHDPENPSCGKSLANGGCDEQVDGSTRHYFYYGGKLVDPHYEGEGATSRYVLNPTAHFGTVGETQESTATTPAKLPADGYYKYSGVYSVYGNTGYFEEQANYVNTVSPDMLALTKELVDGEGNPVKTTADIPFKFTLDLTPDSNAVMTNNDDGKLYYWVGSTEQLKQSPEAGGPPLLSEYQDNIGSLKELTPDEGNPNQYTVTFNAGQAVVIYGLIAGTEYTVTEVKQANYPAYQDHYSYLGTIVHLQPVDPESGVTPYAEMIPSLTVNREGFQNQIITGSLTVEKEISDGDKWLVDQAFQFTVTLTAGDGKTLNADDLTVTKYKKAEDGSETNEVIPVDWTATTDEGNNVTALTATVALKHGERFVISGIPMDTRYTVTESDKGGYNLEYVVDTVKDNRDEPTNLIHPADFSISGTITAEQQQASWLFVNTKPIELPLTGGPGVALFYVIGTALLLASGAAWIGLNRKRKSV